MSERGDEVTRLLHAGAQGEELFPLVYSELRDLAERRMGGERSDHTLQATALVHEAYMRLVRDRDMAWENRRHFFGAASEAMRRVLVDHARKVKSLKRGGDHQKLTLTLSGFEREEDPDQLLALDEALQSLGTEDERAAEIAQLRILGGLSFKEIGEALGLSERTVMRDWTFGRARMTQLLEGERE